MAISNLIMGLGNPGPKYALTRHNIGFFCADALKEIYGADQKWRSERNADTATIRLGGAPVLVAKPQTFMNLSGQALVPIMQFYQVPLDKILIVQDDVDQKFGSLKFQRKRGHGGHNGIRNIHELLGSDDYSRLKLGVGRPPVFIDDDGKTTRSTMDVADWVLHNFSADEQRQMPDFIKTACQAIECFCQYGLERAANLFNQKG